MKIVICGSMSASKEMIEAEKNLKKLGYETVIPSFVERYAEMEVDSIVKMSAESTRDKMEHNLIRGYFNKIKDSDAILVVNVERRGVKGYVGGNSFLEMGFAFILNKLIYFLNEIPDMGYKD